MPTTNTPDQRLSFPYGATPPRVIKDRIKALGAGLDIALGATDRPSMMFYPQALPTVLDALLEASDASGTPDKTRYIKASPAYRLRVDILAILGIDESEGGE